MWRSSSARTRLRASSFCPSAGSSRGHSPGSIVAEGWPRIGNVSTERRSPSSASPPSASCYENSAIQDNVPGQTLRVRRAALEEQLKKGGADARSLQDQLRNLDAQIAVLEDAIANED